MRICYDGVSDRFLRCPDDELGCNSDLELPGLSLTTTAAAKLRKLLCPAPTPERAEQAEVAALEAEFAAAKRDGRLDYWTYIDGMTMHQYQLGISDGKLYGDAIDSRLAAARAAAEKLRAIKPALRPVESMRDDECRDELRNRGWARFVNDAWLSSAWVRFSRAIWEDNLASPTDSIRSVLTRARELDAEEPNRD